MFARLSAMLERGIWGARIANCDIALKAPWSKAIGDDYFVKRNRVIRVGGWVLVISWS